MTPWVKRLLAANVVMFVVSLALPVIRDLFVLVPAYVVIRPWTMVSYMFLHGGLLHLLFNMWMLFIFGPRLEARLGGRTFLWLYLVSGIGGAMLSFVFTPLVRIVGASGAIYGLMLGYALYWPNDRIYLFGIMPMLVWVLVGFLTVLSLVFGFGGGGGNTAHFAHLGGFGAGFLYLKLRERWSPARRFRQQAAANPHQRSGSSQQDLKRWTSIRREDLHEVNREELDRILDKIRVSGVGSLTVEERGFLDRFSSD